MELEVEKVYYFLLEMGKFGQRCGSISRVLAEQL
jgi:hypothetical protein